MTTKSFNQFCKERWKMGAKEYGEDTWKDKSMEELIIDAQEELADFSNYIIMLREKGLKIERYEDMARVLFGNLERIKNDKL